MNIENIKKLRDHIATIRAESFDMRDWIKSNKWQESYTIQEILRGECGTTCCLAGFAATLKAIEDNPDKMPCEIKITISVWAPAQRWLGLNNDQAGNLFLGHWTTFSEPFRSSAIAVRGEEGKRLALAELDYIIETGRI